jgi:hypothetical protein
MSQAKSADTTLPAAAVPAGGGSSRRALLTTAPAAAAAALAGGTIANAVAISMAEAAKIDPVFEAIERERAAYAAYLVPRAIQSQVSDQNPFPSPKPLNRRAENKRLASPEHRAWWARYKEAEAACTESGRTLWSAREAFLQTQPTSVAGLRAYLDHIEGPFSSGEIGEANWDENEKELAFPTLAAASRNLIGGRQA